MPSCRPWPCPRSRLASSPADRRIDRTAATPATSSPNRWTSSPDPLPRRPGPTSPDSRPPRRHPLDTCRPGPSTTAADFASAGDPSTAPTDPTNDRRPGTDWRPADRSPRSPSPTAGPQRRPFRTPCDHSDRPGRHRSPPIPDTSTAEARTTTRTFDPTRSGMVDRFRPCSDSEPRADPPPPPLTTADLGPAPGRWTLDLGDDRPTARHPSWTAPGNDRADQRQPATIPAPDQRPYRAPPALTTSGPGHPIPTDQPPPTENCPSLSLGVK